MKLRPVLALPIGYRAHVPATRMNMCLGIKGQVYRLMDQGPNGLLIANLHEWSRSTYLA